MPFVVMSSDLDILSPAVNAKLYDLGVDLMRQHHPDFMPALGMYKGKVEKSYMVPLHDEDEYDHVRAIAGDFHQESILLVDDDMTANLIMLKDGTVVPLGEWVYVGIHQPETEAWTLIGNAYFVCQ